MPTVTTLFTAYPLPVSAYSCLPTAYSTAPAKTLHSNGWLIPSTHNNASKPLFAHVGVRLPERFSTRCSSTVTQVDTGMWFSFFREMGFDEREFELFLEKNPVARLAPFESVRARVMSLQSVGLCGLALYRLIVRYPEILIAEEIDEFIGFIRYELEGRIEPFQIERVLGSTDPRFLVGFDQKVRLLLNHGVPRDKIAHVLNNTNLTKAICLKPAQEIERTITFLDRYGGINMILKRPKILNLDLERQLIPRVRVLKELSGGDEDATANVLRKLPAILSYSSEHMKCHVELLRSHAGLSDEEIFKIFLVFPNVASASRERKLHPRITFLKECGFDSGEIFKFLSKAPLFLGLSFEDNLACKLALLVKIGYKYRTKELVFAIGATTRASSENLQKVIGVLSSFGLSYEDIFIMSKKHPQILQYNPSSLEEKIKYLTGDMGRDVSELLAFPAFLGYNLDDRIKHRYEAKRKTIGERMSINKLLTVSADRFLVENLRENQVQTHE